MLFHLSRLTNLIMENTNSSHEFQNSAINNQFPDFNSFKKTWDPKSRPVPSDQKHGKKREHSPEEEWRKKHSPPQSSPYNSREHEGTYKPTDELKFQPALHSLQPPISIHAPSTSTYPTYGYAFPYNNNVVDPCRSYYMPQLNINNTMNRSGASVSLSMPTMVMASTNTGMNPYPYVVPADPSMYRMMGPMPVYCPMPMMNDTSVAPPKVTKTFLNCTLVAPPPNAIPPTRRNRPYGCKTVFVGGLPKKCTEEIVTEAFSVCGVISTVRMSKKNFCHIRFASEHMVELAMFFSGYRLKIENKDEPDYSSRIHVDYAIARDDRMEYEYWLLRFTREMQREGEGLLPPSSRPIVGVDGGRSCPYQFRNYSECEAASLSELLCNEESFEEACEVLITWLDRGECNERNASTFYSVIQSTYSHLRNLVDKKTRIEGEITAVKQKRHQQSTANAQQFRKIENIFNLATAQKVWDHFTKAQLLRWKLQIANFKKQNLEDLLEETWQMEMIYSKDQKPSNVSELYEELSKVCENKKMLQEEVKLLRSSKDKSDKEITSSTGAVSVTESEVRLVILIATFLNVHPLGESIDFICRYLGKMNKDINTRDVENLMKKFNTVFKEESTGIGATLEKKWIFLGYKFCTSQSTESIF